MHASIHDYDLKDYEKALAEAEQAYRLYPLAQILFNIAQCHKALKHWERAAFFYQRYLSRLPAAPNRVRVEAFLAEVEYRLKLEQSQAPAPAPPAVVAPEPATPEAAPPAEAPAVPTPAPSVEAKPVESVPPAAVEPSVAKTVKPRHSHTASYALGAVAVASLVVMVIGIVQVENYESSAGKLGNTATYPSYPAWQSADNALAGQLSVDQAWEAIAFATGAVALGTGTGAVLTW